MSKVSFQENAVRDPRLGAHLAAAHPAWLWTVDGSRILWANAAGAAALGLPLDPGRVLGAALGPADHHRREIERLARNLPASDAMRLQRMPGFGAAIGHLATCVCTRFAADEQPALLVVNIGYTGRPLPPALRLQFAVDGVDRPAAAFSVQGGLVAANRAAKRIIGNADDLARLGLRSSLAEALATGRAAASEPAGDVALYRIGHGHETAIVAFLSAAGLPGGELPGDDPFADEILINEDMDETESESAPAPTAPEDAVDAAAAQATLQTPPAPQAAEAGMAAPAGTAGASAEPSRKQPLRFLWQMDREQRFSIGSDEFSKLIGPLAAAALGRPWREIAAHFDLDPKGAVERAIATQQTWSGIVVQWPINDAGDRLPIELSGLPIYDRLRAFAGYRGFGLCREADRLDQLAALRRDEMAEGTMHPAARPGREEDAGGGAAPAALPDSARTSQSADNDAQGPDSAPDASAPTDAGAPLAGSPAPHPAANVVPFRPANDQRGPALTPVENHAFDEIARRLSARLEHTLEKGENTADETSEGDATHHGTDGTEQEGVPAQEQANWLAAEAGPAKGISDQDKVLLDHIPVGVLIYRLDHLLYANPAFLKRVGFDDLHALSAAGGLDALYVEPLTSTTSSRSEDGMPLTIATLERGEERSLARLFTISWDREEAMALIFSTADGEPPKADQPAGPAPDERADAPEGRLLGEDLAAIIDTTADGVVVFDREGNILACNRSSETLFNEPRELLTERNLADLFAPESQATVLAYYESLEDGGISSLMDHGREVLGLVRGGGLIPLSMTMGRAGEGDRYFAVFRDLSQMKKNAAELMRAQRSAERAKDAKADALASLNHEIREPLNAIIGFAEGMIEQRFGPLGNDRYVDYIKDIRTAGEHVLAIIDDTLELARIETGARELKPTRLSLNDLVAQCIGALQPQANRERVIIRSSLAHHLPPVMADASSLRQILSSVVAGSVSLAEPGGQVIVSTAPTDAGEIVLRLRDTGRALTDQELLAAVAPHRGANLEQLPAPETIRVNLALAKALVEANRGQFSIRRAPHAGTLIEVVFAQAAAAAAHSQE